MISPWDAEPYFVPAACHRDCSDRMCPYIHNAGWMIEGVEGLFSSPDDARHAQRSAFARALAAEGKR